MVTSSEADVVRIVRRRGDRDGAGGPCVDVRELVRDGLQLVRAELALIHDGSVVRRLGRAEQTGVRHQVEVVVIRMGDLGIDDCAGSDVARPVAVLRADGEEPGMAEGRISTSA